jgi:hypothetical protein
MLPNFVRLDNVGLTSNIVKSWNTILGVVPAGIHLLECLAKLLPPKSALGLA